VRCLWWAEARLRFVWVEADMFGLGVEGDSGKLDKNFVNKRRN